MPRSEEPLDGVGALVTFANELRELRRRAGGIPYRSMARLCHYSASALAEAANGRKLPSLAVTLAYVRACGGDAADWETRWRELSAAVAAEAEAASVAPATLGQLPPRTLAFTGREAELTALAGLLAPAEPEADTDTETEAETDAGTRTGGAAGVGVVVVTAVAGLAGVGKTELAVQAAHAAVEAGHFPGGVLFVDLHGYDEAPVGAAQSLDALLRGLGAPPERIPADLDTRAAAYRARLAGHPGAVLVIADNASTVEQVRPLLPGDSRHRVVVTSRHTLPSLGARLLDLAVLPEGEAVALLAAALHAADPQDRRVEADPVGATRLAHCCGRLPLALQIAAALLVVDPDQTIAELAAELADAGRRLDRLADGERGVRAAFELSHQRLTPTQVRLFRLLGLHPGPEITAPVAAALADESESDARAALAQLTQAHMIERTGVPRRWRLHDLIAAYARELAARLSDDEREAALGKLLDYYLHATRAADQHLAEAGTAVSDDQPGPERSIAALLPRLTNRDEAWAWLEAERANLHACAVHAAATGHPAHATGIAHAAATFLDQAGHWRHAEALHQAAAQAAQAAGNAHAHATALRDLGRVQYLTGQYAAAVDTHTAALALFQDLADWPSQAEALTQLGRAQQQSGQYAAATDNLTRALKLYRQVGNWRGQATALADLGAMHYLVGQLKAAVDSHTQALGLYRQLEDTDGQATALNDLGSVQRLVGEYASAIDNNTKAVELYRRLGNRRGEANALAELGPAQYLTGQYEAAADTLNQALELYRQLGDRHGHAAVLTELGVLLHLTGRHAAAADNLSQALDLCRRLGDVGAETWALNHYAALVAATDDPGRGRALHQEALRIARQIDARWDEANALAGIAATHHTEGDLGQAAAVYRQALTLYQDMGCQADSARLQAILADL
jgi:tetratricopeptide (TPR) repeat protein